MDEPETQDRLKLQADGPRAPSMEDFWIQMGWFRELPGGRRRLRRGCWQDPLTRQDAVRFLVEQVLRKDPRQMAKEDFERNRLGGLLNTYYGNKPREALNAAGYSILPWEMANGPWGFYEDPENRRAATRWLVEKCAKDPREIQWEDFYCSGLAGLMIVCEHSPCIALREAGYAVEPWEMGHAPRGFYAAAEIWARALKWLVEKTGLEPRDLTRKDFAAHGLWGVLNYTGGSPYACLREAGLVSADDESYMRRRRSAKHGSPAERRPAQGMPETLEEPDPTVAHGQAGRHSTMT
jgi:hypothetical protein